MKTKELFVALCAILLVLPALEARADGAVTFEVLATFDYPGLAGTAAAKINDEGYLVGSTGDNMGHLYGYVRSPAGHLSQLISYPNTASPFTALYGINNLRQMCGSYDGGPRPGDGFLLSHHTFTTADFPGAYYNDVLGLNDAGDFCGDHSRGGNYSGFVNVAGTYISFQVPLTNYTGALAINNLGQCAGYYYTDTEEHGFRRDADGTLTYPIDAPGFLYTALYGINDHGWMVGEAGNSTGISQGVLFRSLTMAETYSYPGATLGTAFLGINNHGLICGSYVDGAGTHGLLVKAVVAE